MPAPSELILAIDQGTTGTTALLMTRDLERIAEASVDFPQHFPKPGWVEHDLGEIWASTLSAIKQCLERAPRVDPKRIVAIGITNQRETLCFWDKATAEPLARAIVWQDRRTAEICDALKAKGAEKFVQERTGLLLDPYFSGTKAAWALKHWPELKRAHSAGKLAAGTIDSFLIARLNGGSLHVTEPSNASRTLCYSLEKRAWDPELCSMLSVPIEIWPEIRMSTEGFGSTRGVPGLPDGIPISGVLGDQQSALLGQACLKDGMAKCTFGTGAFLLLNTGKKPVKSRHRLLTTVAWAFSDDEYAYALEGSAFIAGAAVQWLRDGLGLIPSAEAIEALASEIPDSDGVTFVPALTGLGAPHWSPSATGMFTGLTRGTTRAHLARAVLEGIAFQNADLLGAMEKDLGKPLESVNVDGGAAANNLLMQFQADILGTELRRPRYLETTSLGAVFAAGLGEGIWKSPDEIEKTWHIDRAFKPGRDDSWREQAMERWQKAVARTLL